jgi:hypothetical protein
MKPDVEQPDKRMPSTAFEFIVYSAKLYQKLFLFMVHSTTPSVALMVG